MRVERRSCCGGRGYRPILEDWTRPYSEFRVAPPRVAAGAPPASFLALQPNNCPTKSGETETAMMENSRPSPGEGVGANESIQRH